MINPRAGVEFQNLRTYWQLDRGFWAKAHYAFGDLGLGGLVWWNPDWQAQLAPKKLLFGLWGSWRDQLRVGFDISAAPVEVYRVYMEIWAR